MSTSLSAAETKSNYDSLVTSVNQLLLDKYVFPEIAPKYVEKLNMCMKNSCLSDAKSKQEVGEILSAQLQSIHKDKHLKVFSSEQTGGKKKRKRMMGGSGGLKGKTGIAEQKILEGGIGYLKMDLFPGSNESIAATNQALIELKDTNAIIFDIREHRGGSPRNITEISNFLFQEETHMITTRSPHVNNGAETPHISQPNEYAKYFKDKPIYVLTSKKSGSAAEHFAMAMKSTGRAILVGETTGGYGHWGEIVKLEQGFSIFVPSGRSYHPVNKLGWEGIGVTPDILTSSEDSYDYTLNRIRARI